jgi:hypothetical protein
MTPLPFIEGAPGTAWRFGPAAGYRVPVEGIESSGDVYHDGISVPKRHRNVYTGHRR